MGSLKLNENPAAFEFKSEHVVNRGSTLYMTEQIICIVLNIGEECLGSVMRERNNRTPSFFAKLIKFKELKYHKYHQGDMKYNIRILQVLSVGLSFLSWFTVLFAQLVLGRTGLVDYEENVLMQGVTNV